MPRENFTLNQHAIADGTIFISKVYGETHDGKGRRVAAIVRNSKVRVTPTHFVTSLPGLATAVARLLGTGDPKGIATDADGKKNARNQSGTGFFAPYDNVANADWRSGMTFPRAMIAATKGVTIPEGMEFGEDVDILIWEDDSVTARGAAPKLPETIADNDSAIAAENVRHERRIAALKANGDRLKATAAAPVTPVAATVETPDAAPVATGKGKGKNGKGK